MSSEIEIPKTPNWLKELEETREKRLKARLGHEAGAGAPCLKCEDKCPGLDLHFWRKACKICRCSKEEHDVPDDDVYGWAKFQLLGSKPTKIKRKIVLPGRKEEIELEWAPKGQKDTIDKYLQTLPAENLPVKGSQAAQERKQMLQKQIPIHDIDPSLCHELNENEVKNMEDYIAYIKKHSVGVGQIVSLSAIIKANLHEVNPQETHIMVSRNADKALLTELEKKQDDLSKCFKKRLNVKTPDNITTQSFNEYNSAENRPTDAAIKYKDLYCPLYANDSELNPQYHRQEQYLQGFIPKAYLSNNGSSTMPHSDYTIDEKLLDSTKFDPSKIPSQFYTSANRKLNQIDLPITQYGFKNPLFDNQQRKFLIGTRDVVHGNAQNSNISRNITDLINSKYGPITGTDVVPVNTSSSNNNNININQMPFGSINISSDLEFKALNCPRQDDHSDKFNYENQELHGVSTNKALKHKKSLSELHPGQLNIPEDYLEPHIINIGSIQDINPIINSATAGQIAYHEDNNFKPKLDNIKQYQNSTNLPNCHYCKKSFEENEFAVVIDRANVLFHVDCFRCAGCNENLADNIYFYHKGTDNIYCGRDYAKMKGYPRCKACDELIFTKEYCLTENTTFHLKHFCCFQCDTPLAGLDYTLEDEKPYCLPCYEESKAARCSTCMRVIKPNETGCQLKGIHFHVDCFKCIVCSNPLMQKKLLLRREKLYCSHKCFNGAT